MGKKMIAVFMMCILVVAATASVKDKEAKFDAKFKSCYENCEKKCLEKGNVEGNGQSFCEVKCDEDCNDKEVADKLNIKIENE